MLKVKRFFIYAMMSSLLISCSSAYYNTMEKFGVHKRDIMVDRVAEARDSQENAKQQFNSALEEFSSVLDFDGGNLQQKYEKLNQEYEGSLATSNEVAERISAVEDVSAALFKEWDNELDEYQSASLKAQSEQKLRRTKTEYRALIGAMKNAESKIPPVLEVFQDQVLFLKHNLNAQAISALQAEYSTIENDVADLIREMQKSIDEANAFIDNLANNS